MTLSWDDIRTVTLLVRNGSLAATGEALGINYTTVARRVRRAEEALGETLFERLADGYHPTDAARIVAEHGGSMETADYALHRSLAGRDARLSGTLTVTAPQLLVAHAIAPVFAEFSGAYPEVDLRIRATNDVVDLSRREADLAIRISRSPGDDLKGLRLAPQDSAGFATRDWADRIADDPDGPVDWLVFAGHPDLPKGVAEASPGSRIRYRFDDMVAMAGAAAAGLGVARMPMFLGRSLGLVQVPILPPQPYIDLWAVAHPDVWPSARVRAFTDLLVPFVRARRADFIA